MYRDRHYTFICVVQQKNITLTEHVIRNIQGQTHIKDNFNFVNDTHSLRQSDIVDYRAAYFAAKNMNKEGNSIKRHF